ncbi:MAG TPA: thiamine pyrophosphate-dependent enzyme [Kofleriaceae bacterium]|nr:thiamine pyrophosphate-dependent enzyme [Kofleriaceae bacterium]
MQAKHASATAGEVVGWGAQASWSAPTSFTASGWIGRELFRLGVRHAFAVLGGGIAAFADGLARSEIRIHHTRHESGAAFAAIEAHFASDRPSLVVVTTGPGLYNALNGAMAARADGARLLLVSGATSRTQRGRGAVQETTAQSLPPGLASTGPLFHLAAQPESMVELQHFLQQLACGWSRPGGFVAHLALPWTLQTELVDLEHAPVVAPWGVAAAGAAADAVDATLERLAAGSAALWIGHGARQAASEVRAFAEAAGLPVIASPRARGVFDEEHPLFVGVSGAGGHVTVPELFAKARPETVLVLGSRLGEVTSFLSSAATPSRAWIHVDVDPSAFGAAFPGVPGMGVTAEVRAFVSALDARARATGWYASRARVPMAMPHVERPARLEARDGDVRHPYLMQVVQEQIVDATDAVVMSEAGNAFTWCNHALRFRTPGRYRTSAAWGSMGHFTAGCVGAALATGRRAVAVVGDGAMLMTNEINTAVAYQADALWIVLNDAQLGLNEHGMSALGMRPVETQLPRTDFAAFAESQGATGLRVETEAELEHTIALAMTRRGPVVVDVRVDRTVPSPILALRIQSLAGHGGGRQR